MSGGQNVNSGYGQSFGASPFGQSGGGMYAGGSQGFNFRGPPDMQPRMSQSNLDMQYGNPWRQPPVMGQNTGWQGGMQPAGQGYQPPQSTGMDQGAMTGNAQPAPAAQPAVAPPGFNEARAPVNTQYGPGDQAIQGGQWPFPSLRRRPLAAQGHPEGNFAGGWVPGASPWTRQF